MTFLTDLHWHWSRWCRNSAVATLTIVGMIAVKVGLDVTGVAAIFAAAIATLALVDFDWRGKPFDDVFADCAP